MIYGKNMGFHQRPYKFLSAYTTLGSDPLTIFFGIPVPDYMDENVSDKVVKIIQSYTGVVDKMVWRKS